jgi:hypothetical protein
VKSYLFMSDFLHAYEITAETIPSAFDAMFNRKRDAVIIELYDDKIDILEFDKNSNKLRYLSPFHEKVKIEEIIKRFRTYILEESMIEA